MKILLRLSYLLMGVGGFSTASVALSMTPHFLRGVAYFVALIIPAYAYFWIVDEPTAEALGMDLHNYYALLFASKAVVLLGSIVTLGVIWHG